MKRESKPFYGSQEMPRMPESSTLKRGKLRPESDESS